MQTCKKNDDDEKIDDFLGLKVLFNPVFCFWKL